MDISAFVKEMGLFGSKDPKQMPGHFFYGAVYVDYDNAIRADISKQDFSVAPRHGNVDCDFLCRKCRQEFTWTAREQQVWFGEYRFCVDSQPWLCKRWNAAEHRLDDLRREYDATAAAARERGTPEQKQRIIDIVRELQTSLSNLPQKMLDTLQLFELQTAKAEQGAAGLVFKWLN